MSESPWSKLKTHPLKGELVEDLKRELLPIRKDSAHATHIALGRQELALELLRELGEI